MVRVNPEMIALARESRGYTQTDLANMLGLVQGRLSKIEKGLVPVSDELLSEISMHLKYKSDLFFESAANYAAGITLHRKRASLPKRTLDKIQAHLTIRKLHIAKLLEDINFPEENIPSCPIKKDKTPTDIAKIVRSTWKIPRGPIDSLMPFFERAGILVVPCNLGHRYIDAVSYRVSDLPPLIFLNSSSPGDRQRFTLAHELGHLVMHKVPSECMEKEADEFASELLMPEEEIARELKELNMHKLWKLKPRWNVSMAALVKRAKMVGSIPANKEQYLWVQLSKSGYRLEEPVELYIEPEKPTFINKIIELNLEDCSRIDLSNKLYLSELEFAELYMTGEEKPKRKRLAMS